VAAVTRRAPLDPREAALRRRLRRTGWTLAAVMFFLAAGAACFIAVSGHKSRTVLHSERSSLSASRAG
jgi:hypothetical protein